ncbi:hypothetical protein Q5752_003265 [Cryptotrichosporon argae]
MPITVYAENDVATTHGIFHPAGGDAVNKALLVLIHGGGTNATYFDNTFHSIPAELNALGYNVLNVNRPGYGSNPVPNTDQPLRTCSPLYAKLFNDVYTSHHGGSGGVILIGHSLGAATSLIIAAEQGNSLPLLGVSALGIIPTRARPDISLFEGIFADDAVQKIPLPEVPTATDLKLFMGAPDFFDLADLPRLEGIFEGGLKNELKEWIQPDAYEWFTKDIAPAVNVPLQFMAGEVELQWDTLEAGRPLFDAAARLFTSVPSIETHLLEGGAHNFEFSRNADRLRQKRTAFIKRLSP